MSDQTYNQILETLSLHAHDIDMWAEISFTERLQGLEGMLPIIEDYLGFIFDQIQ